MADAARRLRRSFDECMRDSGLTGPQARLLLILLRIEGQQQGFYAERMDVEAITLCRMVDRMADAGLVERRSDPSDRRVRRLYPTEKAIGLGADVRILADDLMAKAMDGFSESERETLITLLERMIASLGQIGTNQGDTGNE